MNHVQVKAFEGGAPMREILLTEEKVALVDDYE